MATLGEIKKAFFALSTKEQEALFKEIYGFSKDMKNFLSMRLLGDGDEAFIKEIRQAAQSQTPLGYPKDIKVTQVNSILTKAKRSKVSADTLCQMEWIAFDGYMTYLNDYGGGPQSYENKVYDHLQNYLKLLFEIKNPDEITKEFATLSIYLRRHTNMYYDHIWELYEEMTGRSV